MTKQNRLSLLTATLLLTHTTYADETLENIEVISTNKTHQSIKNTTSNITVITANEIEEKGYLSVAQALNSVAGISVASSGGLGQQSSFFVRGADSGKVLVLLDGMRLNDPSTTNGTALLENLTTATIAQIEILKGGQSSIWGSNASAGVINIITKEAKEGVHGTVGVGYGSFATQKAQTQLSYKDEKFNAQIVASYLQTEGFSALAPRDAEADSYENKNINFKVGYDFDANNQIKLSYNTLESHTEYDDAYSTTQADDNYSHATSTQKNIALNYLFERENYSASFNVSKGEYERDYYTTSAFGDGHNVYQATLKEYSLINALVYGKGKVVLGIEAKEIEGFNQYNTFAKSQANYTNKAIYLSNLYHINDTTLLESNLRYDNFDDFENKTTYKIGLKKSDSLIEGTILSANYYTSYDAPSSYQLANPNPAVTALLKPSYTQGFDISLAYKKLLSLTYFDNSVEDTIDYLSDPLTFIGGYQNIAGTSQFSGVEISSQMALREDILLSANYTHLIDYQKEDGTNLIRRPKETLNASLDYYAQNRMHVGIDFAYIGQREDLNKLSTGDYSLVNLNFDTPLYKETKLTLNAKNIFDKAYASIDGYSSEGRSFYATVKYSF